MANLIGVFTLGNDAELRYLPSGSPVLNLSLAYNYGEKGEDNKRPSQWIDAAIFGKRAESLAPHLLKRTKIFAVLEDPHIETWQKKDAGGTGHKLVARISTLEFVGGDKPAGSKNAPPQSPARGASKPPAGFDSDDIAF